MTTKKHIRDAIMLARDLGVVDARVEKGGKHPHLLGTAPNGEPLRYTLPNSPSDGRRGARNLEADLRRACRAQDADDDVQQAKAEERNRRQRRKVPRRPPGRPGCAAGGPHAAADRGGAASPTSPFDVPALQALKERLLLDQAPAAKPM